MWEAPPPAPPKKCEALSDKCAAKSSTKARISKSTFALTPVSGWMYAQTENALVAQSSDAGAAMVAVGYEAASAKEDIKSREAALDAAAKEIGVTLPKKKVAWKSPIDTKEASGLKIPLWEWEGATRKDKKGTLIVFASTLPENKGFVGFGFVPDDEKEPDKIVEGLQTSIGSVVPQEKKSDAKADETKADGKK